MVAVASGTVTLAANGAIAASTWTWAYVAGAAAGTGTFTLSAAAGGVSSSAAQGLLQSLAYVDIATTPSAGSRGFSITATDVFGNTSTAVSANLNSLQKSQPDLDSSSNGNDFSSNVNVSLLNAQGSAIAPNTAALTSDSSVSRIEVRIAGAGLDLVNDKIVLSGPAAGANPVTVALNAPSASSNNISIGGIGGLRYSYSQPVNNGSTSNLLLITSSTGSIATADVDDIVKALLFNTALVSPVTSARSFQVSVVNAAGVSASSTATLTLVDNVIPVTPTLTLGSGVSGGATLAEATASSGVVSVNAESGSTVLLTFADSSIPFNSIVKTYTGTGSAQAITLAAGELGTDIGKLNDGIIFVSAQVTDVNGNTSLVGRTTLLLDTHSPVQPTLAIKNGQDNTLNSEETSIDLEVSYAGMVAGDVIALFNAASALGSVYTVLAADVAAGKASINVLTSLLGADGSKSITATVSDVAGNPSSPASAALAVSVSGQTPGIAIKTGQDSYLNATETSIDLEVRSSLLAAGDTIQLQLDGSNLGSVYTVLASDITAGRASINVLKSALTGGDGSKSITANFTHSGTTTTSPALTLTLDTTAPSALALSVKSGEDAVINASETSVNLELTGSNIAVGDLVTLKNGSSILVSAYAVTAADLAAGKVAINVAATALGADGVKSLTAGVSDAADNSANSSTLSLTLDTQGPLLGLQPGSAADAFINSTEAAAASGVSVALTGVAVGDVITIKEGNTTLSGPTTLTAAMITAGTMFNTSFARSLLSAGDGVKTLSVIASDAAGNAGRANQLDLLADSVNPAALTVTTPQSVAENSVNVGTALNLPSGASAWKIGGTDAAWFVMDGNQLRFVTAPDFERPRNQVSSASNTNAYSLTLTAVDAAGNSAGGVSAPAMTVNVTDVASESAPVLYLQPGRSSSVSLAEASSGLGVLGVIGAANGTVTMVFSRSGGGTVSKTIVQNANGSATSVWLSAADVATLGDGSISVTSGSAAGAGNSLSFTLDSSAPSGIRLSASGSVFNPATHTLALTANFSGLANGDTLSLLENGVALNQTFTVSNAASGTQTLTLDRYWLSSGDGVKALTLVATDAAGNSSTSAAINLTVDTTAAPVLRSNALIGGVDTSVKRLQLAVDDAVGSDTSTSNGVSTRPYIHITGLDAGSSWQYSLDSGGNWTTVAAHNPNATDATLTLPASSTAYASGAVQVRQIDASGISSPITSNSMALTITPSLTISGAVDDAFNPSTLLVQPTRYLRISTNINSQSLNWSDLRVWVLQNGIETELTARSSWVFTGAPGGIPSYLTDANLASYYNANPVGAGSWLQADLGGYYSVSRVQLINVDVKASNQTVSLSSNDLGTSAIGVAALLGDTSVSNFNTGTLAANSTLTLRPSLATDDATPMLQGKLASSAALPNGSEYAVYVTNLDDVSPLPTNLPGSLTTSGTDWSFIPSSALADGRYAFTLVKQATGNTIFANPSVVPNASSLVLNIDNNGSAASPTLDLNSATVGNNTSVDSNIGSVLPITLTGGANVSTTAPYVDLPDVSLGNDLTLEAWVNFSVLFPGLRVFDIGFGYNNNNLILGVLADGSVFSSIRVNQTSNDIGSTVDLSRPALVVGNWYHLALVVSGATQTIYVNGLPWVTAPLTNNFNNQSPLVRSNTWVGRSNFGESYSAMQIRDVRIFDDARTTSELISDMNGTAVDASDGNLRLAYNLLGHGQSSIGGEAASLVNVNPFPLAPNALLGDASPIASIRVAIDSGLLDGSNERLIVDGNALIATGVVSSGSLKAISTEWNWTYNAASSSFTFNAANGGVSAGLAQAFVQSLGYQDISITPTFGNRTLSISAIDVFGHTSSAATVTLQDATLPGISNLPNVLQPVLRTQAVGLADLVFNKGGKTTGNWTINVTVNASNGSVSGLSDADNNPANGIQLSGTPAQLTSAFASATFQAAASGTPGLSLLLSDSTTGRTATLAYPLIVDDQAAPVLDLNGAANGSNNTVASILGSTLPVNLTGGANNSSTAPYLDLPDVPLGNDLTLEAWVNFSTMVNGQRIFDIGNGQSADNLILLANSDGTLISSIRVGAAGADVQSVLDASHPALVVGQWYHLALVVSGSTQSVFVNGNLWLTGNLPGGFSSTTVKTRSNTWVGRSNFTDPFAQMQVRDVRVFDDARTIGEVSADAANIRPIDTTDPNLRLAYALNGTANSSLPSGTAVTTVNQNLGNLPVAIAPSATLTEGATVRSLKVSVAGLEGGTVEKLTVAGTTITANSASAGQISTNNITWAWTYAVATTTFTFTAPAGGVSSALAQDLLQSLVYSNTSTTPRSRNRVFSITATDIFGNTSTPLTATLDTELPGFNNLPTAPTALTRGTAVDLADLVFSRGGNANASDVLSVTVLADGATLAGLTDADPSTAGIQLSGTAAALSTSFASATLNASASGTPTLNLTLSDNVGHSIRYSYPLVVTASEAVAPVLDFNGSATGVDLIQGNSSAKGNSANPFNLTGNSTATFIDLPDVPLGGDLTLEAWVNFSNLFNWERVFDIGNGTNNSNLVLGVQADGRVSFALRNDGTALVADPSSNLVGTNAHSALVPGTWYHLALVIEGTTAKAFVNGVEWLSATLSAPITDLTRANTWIGKEWSAGAFSNMQVKDVRIYDDARTTGVNSELSSDVSGTPVNTSDPNLRLAYSLLGSTASTIPGRAAAEAVNLLANNTGTSLAPAAVLTDTSPIKSFTITVGGLLDDFSERLELGNTSIPLNGQATSGTLPVGTDTWTWTYTNSAFTFTAPGNGVPTSTIQGLLQSLKYNNLSFNSPTGGTRTFDITTTDIWNNTSSPAKSSIDVGTPTITGQQTVFLPTPGTAMDLNDLTFSRDGNTSSADTLKLSILPINGTLSGVTDADANAAGTQLQGTAAQLGTAFAAAQFTAAQGGTPALLLNLTDAVGHSTNYQYSFIVNHRAFTYLPLAPTLNEDASNVAIAGIRVIDEDLYSYYYGISSVTLTVAHGRLRVTADSPYGLPAANISGQDTNQLILSGDVYTLYYALNNTLATLRYSPDANFNGSDTLTVLSTDNSSSPLTDTATLAINVTSVNDLPVLSGIPGSTNLVAAGVPVALADFTISDTDAATLYLTLTPVNGSVNGFSAGVVNGVTTQINGNVVQLSGPAAAINSAVAAATFTASTAGTASLNVRLSDSSWSDTAVGSSSSASFNFSASVLPVLTLDSGQDNYINSSETSVYLTLTHGSFVQGDVVTLQLYGGSIISTTTVSAAQAMARAVRFTVNRNDLQPGVQGDKSISAQVTHSGLTSDSEPLILTLDTMAPSTPVLALGTGVSGAVSLAEATTSSGVLSVNADTGSTVLVTFKDTAATAWSKPLSAPAQCRLSRSTAAIWLLISPIIWWTAPSALALWHAMLLAIAA